MNEPPKLPARTAQEGDEPRPLLQAEGSFLPGSRSSLAPVVY